VILAKTHRIYHLSFTIYHKKMSFELKLAWRYFRARRKTLARFTSLAAIIGIAAGVASLILAQALARGFSDEMRDKILASTAHVSVFRADGAEISDWQQIKARLQKAENIESISATTYESAVIAGARARSYAVLRLVQSPKSADLGFGTIGDLGFQNEDQRLKTEDQLIEISLGKELAEKTNLKAGDEAEIVLIENRTAPTTRKVFVKDTFQTGLYEYDATWIYISPDDFARLKNPRSFAPTILSVSVKDIYRADEIAAVIRAELGGDFKVVDWQAANEPLFAALSLERRVALAITSLIVFVAALNITTTLALLVGERRLDIAVLRTCGATSRALVFIFLIEGLLLGLAGIAAGVVLGLLGCFLGNYFQGRQSLERSLFVKSYSVSPDLENVLLVIFIAFLLCLSATVYPASKASR
jgi:lipoprotein-releasing system permease protein